MNSHDTSQSPTLAQRAYAFALQFASQGPDFLSPHLPDQFVVGTPTGANTVSRDRFIEAALARASLVTGQGLTPPSLVGVDCVDLGEAYLLITAHWTMPPPTGQTLDGLTEDFLIDRTGPQWICLAYLLRQNLPRLLAGVAV